MPTRIVPRVSSCCRRSQTTTDPPSSPSKRGRCYRRCRAHDILELTSPYNQIKSDDVKRWKKKKEQNDDGTANKEGDILETIAFTNALVLKVNQLSKQVK